MKRVAAKLRRHWFGAHRVIGRGVEPSPLPLIRLGTDYGGWTFVPTAVLRAGGVVVSCGAGEDVSFDVELVRRFGCRVILVDPTPRAIAHFAALRESCHRGSRFPINRSSVEFYSTEGVDFHKLSYVPKAIWKEPGMLKFYVPRDSAHVSHSLVNLQGTDSYIEVEACPLSRILDGERAADPVLIKLDIEGAEHAVIRSFLDEGFVPQQVLVEFDQLNYPSREVLDQVQATIQLLRSRGYRFVHFDGKANCLFVKSEDSR